jgi:hypothetical protein
MLSQMLLHYFQLMLKPQLMLPLLHKLQLMLPRLLLPQMPKLLLKPRL